jgi:hypothetical protein
MRDLDTYTPPGSSNHFRVCQECGHLLAVVNLLEIPASRSRLYLVQCRLRLSLCS